MRIYPYTILSPRIRKNIKELFEKYYQRERYAEKMRRRYETLAKKRYYKLVQELMNQIPTPIAREMLRQLMLQKYSNVDETITDIMPDTQVYEALALHFLHSLF